MISTNEFKNGICVEYEGDIYQVMEFQHVKPGKGQAFVRSKIKNMRTGTIKEFAFQPGLKLKLVVIEKKIMQYIYKEGSNYIFMDTESFEQIEIDEARLKWEKQFMIEGTNVTIMDYEGEVLGVQLKEKVPLKVIECDPGVKGNTAANARKKATLETGYVLDVPLFIEQGDNVVVSTITGAYDSRA